MSALGPDTLRLTLEAVAAFALGAGLGAAYFLTLRLGVRLFMAGRVLAPVALTPLRFLVLGAALYGVASFGGAVPLVAAAGGLLLGRAAILRREREGADG